MELSKKTTILFSPELHRHLGQLAARRGVSLGELVREACVAAYGIIDGDARVAAATALATLRLPVDSPGAMKRQSVPEADALMP